MVAVVVEVQCSVHGASNVAVVVRSGCPGGASR